MDNKSPDAFRTISEVADWLGVPTHVLRFWESRFTQVKPVKRAGGRRYYRPSDMELLGGIRKLLHDDGLTIRGVQKLLREQGVKHVAAMSPPVDMDAVAESNVVSLAESRRAVQTDEAGTDAQAPSDEPADDSVFATDDADTDDLESAPEPVDVAIEAQDVAQTTPAAGEEIEDLTPVSYETVDEAEADEAPMGLAVDDLGTLDADDTTGRAVEEMTDFNPFAAATSPAEDDIPEGTDDDIPLAVEDDAGLAALVSDSLQDDAPDWSGQDLADPAVDEADSATPWSEDADSGAGEEATETPPLETEAEADSSALSTLDGVREADHDLLPPAEPDDLPDPVDDSPPNFSALDLDESATGTPADVPSDAEPTPVFDAADSTPVTTDSDPTLDPVDTEDDDSLVATPPDFASQTDDDPVAVDAAVHAVLGDEDSVDDADALAINPPSSDAEPSASPRPALVMPDIGPDPVDGHDAPLTPVATRLRALRAAGKPLPTAALSALSARLAALRANAHKGSGPATRL